MVFMPGACSASSSCPKYDCPAPPATIRLSYGISTGSARRPRGVDDAPLEVEAGDLGELDPHVAGAPQDVAQRRRDLARRQDAGGHLVQQRLEEVVVAPIEQRDVDAAGWPRNRHGGQPAEAASDDDDAVAGRAVGA